MLALGSGFGVMVLEIAGARIMAPVFGLSAVPWTAVIGVVLAALALGSHLGGKWADEGRIPLASVLLGAGAAAVLPLIAGAFPERALAMFGFIPGAMISALVLFAPPVLALGAVVPYLVKADTQSMATVGRKAGDMSALATAGSIAGTFLTGFVLLPIFPLPILISITAAGIVGLAGLAYWVDKQGPPPALMGVTALVLGAMGIGGFGQVPGLLHREETVYASIAVTERTWGDDPRLIRELWQNGGSSSAEYVDKGQPAHSYARASGFLLEEVGSRLNSALILGGAALTLPVNMKRTWPDLQLDVVELDPAVTRLAAEYFAYGEMTEDPGLVVHHQDARQFISHGDQSWDLIYLDVFDHLLTVPWPMVTVEAMEIYRDHLNQGGFLVANVLTPLGGVGMGFFQRFLATAETVFPVVVSYPVEWNSGPLVTQNVLVVMGMDPATVPSPDWPTALPGAAGAPLTDAHAPVEYLQAKVFLQGLGW